MKADLAPDDFDGLMQAHREQARLRNLSPKESQDNGSGWEDFLILGGVVLIVFVAAVIGIYGAGMAALARSVL